jgi:hypothetical protein
MAVYELMSGSRLKYIDALKIDECGGCLIRHGDSLLVKAPLAGYIYLKYRAYLEEPRPVRLSRLLANGSYEVRQHNTLVENDKFDTLDTIEQGPAEAIMAEDRSMGSKKAAFKKRRK